MGKPDRALVYLQAVGEQQEYLFCVELLSADEPVIEGDHEPLKTLFPFFKKCPQKHKKGIKHLKYESPERPI